MTEVTSESCAEKVQEIIRNNIGADAEKITPDANFMRDLGCDSLDCVDLVMTFEDAFGVEITDGEAESAPTVGQMVVLINSKLAAKGGQA
jgi:acyl carrier protein